MAKFTKYAIYQLGVMALLSCCHNEAKKALKGHCGSKGRKAHWRCKKRDGSKSANPTVILSLEPTGAPTTTQSDAPSALVLNNDNIKLILTQWENDSTLVEKQFGKIEDWDVSRITDMEGPLFNMVTEFNSDISGWNMAGVTKTNSMFEDADKFNVNIADWNMSNVIDTGRMFQYASAFNQNISAWDMSSVSDTYSMFFGRFQETAFNQNIGGWDMSSNTNSYGMFKFCNNFNQNLSGWDMSKVTDMADMFHSNVEFNQDLSSWKVAKVVDFMRMFDGASKFKQNLCDWDFTASEDHDNMFAGTSCEGGHTPTPNVSVCFNCAS